MFINIKNQISNPEIRKVLAACVWDNSEKGMDKVEDDYKRRDDWQIYGWSEDGKIVGVCGFEVHSDWLEILHIATCESARGRGIGRLIIAELQERYSMNIEAETDDDAVDFYRKCGFEATEIRKYDVRRWACVLGVSALDQ